VPDLFACLGLVALCLASFWPVFAGHVLLPAEGLFFVDPVFAQHRPPDVSPWQNVLLVADITGQFYPWREYAARSLAAGHIPLWNPYSGCGMPFLANDNSAVLNPVNLILNRSLSPPAAQTVFALLTLLVASLSTYGFVRALRATPVGAFLGGLTYGFFGFIFIWLGYPLAATAAVFPLLLWATYHLADRPSATGAAVIGAIIGWQFLAGHLSTSVQMLAFWAAFAVYEIIRRRSSAPPKWACRYASMLCLALVLGGSLGAAQLLPLREYFSVSTISATGRSRWSGASVGESVKRSVIGELEFLRTIAPGEVALLFNPEAHGHPAFGDYRQYPGYGNYAERTSYPGTLALLALVAALLQRPPPGHRRFFVVAGWVMFAALLHLPIANSLTYLPALRLAAPQRMRFIFSLCAAASLGLAASEWASQPGLSRRDWKPMLWALAVLALASALMAVRALPFMGPHLGQLPPGLRALRLLKLFCPTVAAAAVAVVLLLAGRGRLSGRAMTCALVVIAIFDMVVFGARWHALSSSRNVLPMLPEIRGMLTAADGGRVSGSAVMFRPDLSVAYECYDIRAYDPISVARYMSLVEGAYGISQGANPLISLGGDQPSELLECLASARVRWQQDGQGHVGVVPIRTSLPRAYAATSVLPRSGRAALDAVLATGDPWTQTVIEAETPARSAAERIAPAEITGYSPHRVTVRAHTDRSGWLVLTDTYFPGWRASVNGQEAAIVPADYAFRGVPLPPGENVVTFSYEPASYRIGLFVTCLSLCAGIGLLAGNAACKRCRAP
jgi:hypothetical protein